MFYCRRTLAAYLLFAAVYAVVTSGAVTPCSATGVPFGGFLPFVGMGLTDEYADQNDTLQFFTAEASLAPGGNALGTGDSAHYDLALVDTGANGTLITAAAYADFDLDGHQLDGTEVLTLGGATGFLTVGVTDPLGIYATGLANRTTIAPLGLSTAQMPGQTSVSLLTLPAESDLPNVLGLPFASQYATAIHSDQPQIFELNGKTVRTPQIEFLPLGSGASQGITRRAPLILNPGISFAQPPLYVFNVQNALSGLPLHDNPTSHTHLNNGTASVAGMFVSVDVANGDESLDNFEFFFDTGADVTVISELNAARLGVDPVLVEPEFTVAVIGSGGTTLDVPGYFLDEFSIETVGGSLTATNVPVIVLNVTNAADPGNIVDGIVGTNLLHGRNVVIDPDPSLGGGNPGPQLYISDPITTDYDWSRTSVTGSWQSSGNWSVNAAPDKLGVVNIRQVAGGNQEAVLSTDVTVWEVNVSGAGGQEMSLRMTADAKLTTFSGVNVEEGGKLHLANALVDAQFLEIRGGTLSGSGSIVTGSGPIPGQVENHNGTVAPGDGVGELDIAGRFANGKQGVLEIEIGGTTGVTEHDLLAIDGDAAFDGTLSVSLVALGSGDPFTPTVDDAFEIVTFTGNSSGIFETLDLPDGFNWAVDYLSQSVVLKVLDPNMLPGDFNSDGRVDGTDFDFWEAGYGQPNGYDGDDFLAWQRGFHDGFDLAQWEAGFGQPGGYNGQDFLDWQRNYGAGATVGAVPEPHTLVLAAILSLIAPRSNRSRLRDCRRVNGKQNRDTLGSRRRPGH